MRTNDAVVNFLSSPPLDDDEFYGNHKWTFVSNDGVMLQTVSHQDTEDGVVIVANNDFDGFVKFDKFVDVFLAVAESGGVGGLTLRSFPGRGHDDGWDSTDDDMEEARGWLLFEGKLEPLSSQAIMDSYCTDAITGDILEPEPNVRYCDARVTRHKAD